MYEEFKEERIPVPGDFKFEVANARTTDLDQIVTLFSRQNPSVDQERIRTGLIKELGSDSGSLKLFVARHQGEIIGFSRLDWLEAQDGPAGWYLLGLVVSKDFRGRGVGLALTRARIQSVSGGEKIYYFANAKNRVSIALHEQLGFEKIREMPRFDKVEFEGGRGCLFRAVVPSSDSTSC